MEGALSTSSNSLWATASQQVTDIALHTATGAALARTAPSGLVLGFSAYEAMNAIATRAIGGLTELFAEYVDPYWSPLVDLGASVATVTLS